MEEEPRYRAVLKKQVKAADGTIDISWINEDLITFVKDRLGHDPVSYTHLDVYKRQMLQRAEKMGLKEL